MALLTTRTIVGLEIHVQLRTVTKLFCGCPVLFDAPPNSCTCEVCLGHPGSLPVINRKAVEFAVLTGMALHCDIATHTKWDRKSYYYPDLPKNYQISQYDTPIAKNGHFDIELAGELKRIRIRRAHLEEDAGKNIHDIGAGTLVDLNRAGTPLLEIVTEPDMASPEEAYVFCTELQRLVRHLGVAEAGMQKGQMRFEPNVNVAIVSNGREFRTPIAEIKNINSFRFVRQAIEYEQERHVDRWQADPNYVLGVSPNENRGWDAERGMSEFQRDKEGAHDYRYFPDPDLVPLELSESILDELRSRLPELPVMRRRRWVADLGLSRDDADLIVDDRPTADLFDAVIAAGAPSDVAGKQFVNVWMKLAETRGERHHRTENRGAERSGDRKMEAAGDQGEGSSSRRSDADRQGEGAGERHGRGVALLPAAEDIAALARMTGEGVVSRTAAAQVAEAMVDSPESPRAIAERLGLIQVRDEAATRAWVEQAFAENAQAVQDAVANPKKAKAAAGFLRGQVMKVSGGKADPNLVGELIEQGLAVRRDS